MAYFGLKPEDFGNVLTMPAVDPDGGVDEGSVAHDAMRFYAKLTGSAVSGGITYYSWKEQQRVVDTGGGFPGWVDLPGGRFGSVPGDPDGGTTFSNPAMEPNGQTLLLPTIARISKSYFDPTVGWVYVATVGAAASGIAVKDLKSGTIYSPVVEIDFDSTPTAYDATKGDYVFTYNATTRVLKIRLNGFTGTVNGMNFSNGLLKTLNNPSITNGPPPAGQVNHAYSFTYTASGGVQPYVWSVTGTLPTGLSFSSAGVLSGTPTIAGTYSGLVFTVTDQGSDSATQSVSMTINP